MNDVLQKSWEWIMRTTYELQKSLFRKLVHVFVPKASSSKKWAAASELRIFVMMDFIGRDQKVSGLVITF